MTEVLKTVAVPRRPFSIDCAVCGKAIERYLLESDHSRQTFTFVARCHDAEDRMALTRTELEKHPTRYLVAF